MPGGAGGASGRREELRCMGPMGTSERGEAGPQFKECGRAGWVWVEVTLAQRVLGISGVSTAGHVLLSILGCRQRCVVSGIRLVRGVNKAF